MTNEKTVQLAYGNGGALTSKIINEIFLKNFNNAYLNELTDSAILPFSGGLETKAFAFTTDSYVVNPIFFPGGNIGKLSVCGTLNDLASVGAKPAFMSCGFIIEEGLSFNGLSEIVESMAEEAKNAEIKIVTGDTKVVEKGSAHKIFINTSGIGFFDESNKPLDSDFIIGDSVLINGTIGDHGIAVLTSRNDFGIDVSLKSDCANLFPLIKTLRENVIKIKFIRDATRGGVASVLNEIASKYKVGIEIKENLVPVSSDVKGVCELLGFDPLYIANEGKIIIVVKKEDEDRALEIMKRHPLGINAAIIGNITGENRGKVVLETIIKGKRIIDLLISDQFPRIC